MLRRQLVELSDELPVPAEGELRVDALLERRQQDLLQPRDRELRERLVLEICERRPAPEGQASRCSSNAGSASPRASACPASSVSRSNRLRSSCSPRDVEDVAGRPGLEPRLLAERLAKLRDLAVHLRRRRHGGAAGIELVGEPVDRDDPVRVQEQDRERRPLLRPAEPDRPVGPDDLERAEDPELEHRADGSRSVARR